MVISADVTVVVAGTVTDAISVAVAVSVSVSDSAKMNPVKGIGSYDATIKTVVGGAVHAGPARPSSLLSSPPDPEGIEELSCRGLNFNFWELILLPRGHHLPLFCAAAEA